MEALDDKPGGWEQEDADKAVTERCKDLSRELKETKGQLLIQRAVHPPFLIKGKAF
jgi:hypothetical protein